MSAAYIQFHPEDFETEEQNISVLQPFTINIDRLTLKKRMCWVFKAPASLLSTVPPWLCNWLGEQRAATQHPLTQPCVTARLQQHDNSQHLSNGLNSKL